jgi:predicted RNA binding protein YcfA (HicA-like mRNA interferase family)
MDRSAVLRTRVLRCHLRKRECRAAAGFSKAVPDGAVPPVKVRQVIRLIESHGWRLARIRGSHRQYKHPKRPGVVTIAGRPGDDLAAGTLNSVLKQAGLKKCES